MKFKIWIDHEEQWDASTVDPPDGEVEAEHWMAAAEKFAEDCGWGVGEDLAVIVEHSGVYTKIKLERRFKAVHATHTTLEELCSP